MQMPSHAHDGGHDIVSGAAAATSADTDGTVRFPSRETIERSGIEVVPAEMRPTVLRTNPLAYKG